MAEEYPEVTIYDGNEGMFYIYGELEGNESNWTCQKTRSGRSAKVEGLKSGSKTGGSFEM